MIHIGLDLDNTLIHYDKLFAAEAIERSYVPPDYINRGKAEIRQAMILKGLEHQFTELQGYIYGCKIKDAEIPIGLNDTLSYLSSVNCSFSIVSHKTKYPYRGFPYDLHQGAYSWISTSGILDSARMSPKDIHFLPTKEAKIDLIHSLKCDAFIDDLPEILNLINPVVTKILYSQSTSEEAPVASDSLYLYDWFRLPFLLYEHKLI